MLLLVKEKNATAIRQAKKNAAHGQRFFMTRGFA
jgi:hypothetical protein